MLERNYQAYLIDRLREMFPGAIILKNDTQYLQGIPDLTILYGSRWAVLEVKTSGSSRNRPNQVWYISELDKMSFAAFIHPGNEEEVLHALQQALRPHGAARIS